MIYSKGKRKSYSMDEIEQLVIHFRNVLDKAKNSNEFRGINRFDNFPDDCCDCACDMLGYYLSTYGIRTQQVRGEYWDGFTRFHNWLLINDTVIDITGDQFNDEFGEMCYSSAVYIGNETPIHKLFGEKRSKFDNHSFMEVCEYTGPNGRPSEYQKLLLSVYEIISPYL